MKITSLDEWRSREPELLDELRIFAARQRDEPFRNEHGLRGVSAFALHWFLRQLDPTIVFEVGVWRGYSTWIVEGAAPRAEIVCLDPIFNLEGVLARRWRRRSYRSSRATYESHDFSCVDVAASIAGHERPVAFFDDHQHKLPRLRQCLAAGIKHVVFDDNDATYLTHRTLEVERAEPEGAALLDELVETYEIFPALWPVDAEVFGRRIRHDGLGLPVEPAFERVHADRAWHSNVTFVRLR